MKASEAQNAIPLVRVASLLRYARHLESIGAPTARLLACSRIPAEILNYPTAAIPLRNAFRFGELACRALGTEHLGLHVGLASSLDDLGPYGETLKSSLTVHQYIHRGIALFDLLMNGQRLWLSEHGQELRLNIATSEGSGLGPYQSHLETLVVTIAQLRKAAGPEWFPREISVAYRSREEFPEMDVFGASHVLRGTGATYLTIPRELMGLRFPNGNYGIAQAGNSLSPAERPLPKDLRGAVQLQIESLTPRRVPPIDTIAETLAMSRRSLQRSLAEQGLTYSELLSETRMRRGAQWLRETDMSIAEIAFDLGYSDPSNFTRAFRQHTGVPPKTFREDKRAT